MIQSQESTLVEIVGFQNFNGAFPLEDKLCALLGVDLKTVRSGESLFISILFFCMLKHLRT